MIPESMRNELSKALNRQELEARKVQEGSLVHIEFYGDADRELLQRMGIVVDELGPWKIVFLWDEESKLEFGGILTIDNLAMGRPSLGGIRVGPTVTVRDVTSLARGMTMKNAAADLPFGGGKSAIVCDTHVFRNNREEIMSTFARLLRRHSDVYQPGPDVGTNDEDMKTIAIWNGLDCVVSKTEDMGGNRIDILGSAAASVVVAIDEIFNQLYRLRELPQFKKMRIQHLEEATLIIQGFGAVGMNVARFLKMGRFLTHGKKPPTLIGISDSQGYLYCENGLDTDALIKIKESGVSVTRAYYSMNPTAYSPGKVKFANARDDLLTMSADILVPASDIPNYIGIDDTFQPSITIDRAGHWSIIVEGANTLSCERDKQYERERVENILYRQRGTFIGTDYLVNSGGVIFAACEKLVPTPPALDIPRAFLGNRNKVETWLKEKAEHFAAIAEERRKFAEKKMESVIRENIRIFVDNLTSHREMLPCKAAERISLRRIIERDRFVGDVMISDFPTATREMPVLELANLLLSGKSDLIPVVGPDYRIEGVVTDRDITKAIVSRPWHQLKVEDIMTSKENVISSHPQDSITDTIKKLRMRNISAAPVIDKDDRVVGVISSDHLVGRTLLRMLEGLKE